MVLRCRAVNELEQTTGRGCGSLSIRVHPAFDLGNAQGNRGRNTMSCCGGGYDTSDGTFRLRDDRRILLDRQFAARELGILDKGLAARLCLAWVKKPRLLALLDRSLNIGLGLGPYIGRRGGIDI